MISVRSTLQTLILLGMGWTLAASAPQLPKMKRASSFLMTDANGRFVTDEEILKRFGKTREEIAALLKGEPGECTMKTAEELDAFLASAKSSSAADKPMTDEEIIHDFERTPEEIASLLNFGKVMKPDEVKKWRDKPDGTPFKDVEEFFAELKDPKSTTLDRVKSAIYDDEEIRYAVDKDTGLPPCATIIAQYGNASQEQKGYYRALYQYLLELRTNPTYAIQKNTIVIDETAVADLKKIHIQYNKLPERPWDSVIARMKKPVTHCIDKSCILQACYRGDETIIDALLATDQYDSFLNDAECSENSPLAITAYGYLNGYEHIYGKAVTSEAFKKLAQDKRVISNFLISLPTGEQLPFDEWLCIRAEYVGPEMQARLDTLKEILRPTLSEARRAELDARKLLLEQARHARLKVHKKGSSAWKYFIAAVCTVATYYLLSTRSQKNQKNQDSRQFGGVAV